MKDTPDSVANQARWKQFDTPFAVARLMAGFFPVNLNETVHLLDAGAGYGVLTEAFFERCLEGCQSGEISVRQIKATMVEIDSIRCQHLQELGRQIARTWIIHPGVKVKPDVKIVQGDYLALPEMNAPEAAFPGYTHVILNPPYGKVKWQTMPLFSGGQQKFEAANLYVAFLFQAIWQMVPGGHLVAIVPRSFCHGPVHHDFRQFLFHETIIHRIHQFQSRREIFRQHGVVQETVVIHLERRRDENVAPKTIALSVSEKGAPENFVSRTYPYAAVVTGRKDAYTIRLPPIELPGDASLTDISPVCLSGVPESGTLADLGVDVSTGRVLEFRCRPWVHFYPGSDRYPLLHPFHCRDMKISWPGSSRKRPAWIVRNRETECFFHPCGFYVLVRRFSSPETPRRVVSSLLTPEQLGETEVFAVENHLNLIHIGGRGLDENLAWGIMLFLRTTAVERHFWMLIGNNHVNASDLRYLPCPSRTIIEQLGAWGKSGGTHPEEKDIDEQYARLTGRSGK